MYDLNMSTNIWLLGIKTSTISCIIFSVEKMTGYHGNKLQKSGKVNEDIWGTFFYFWKKLIAGLASKTIEMLSANPAYD